MILALVWLLMRSRVARLNQRNLLLEKEANLSQLSLEKNVADQKRMEEEHQAREKINKIEREKLQQELDFKNRMLMSKVMSVSNQNEQMGEVVSIINQAEDLPADELHKALANAKSLIKNQINLENEWESVKVHFEEVHPEFFTRLSKYNANLNSSDLRMCAYLVLDLSPKEISNILNITPASIRKRKQRLREKLGITGEVDLSDWLRKNILDTVETKIQNETSGR
jgi:DNA-binding CsgD family transcriptional regulator